MIELRRVGPEEFAVSLDAVLDVYTAAMLPPADQLTGRRAIMRGHASYSRFTCLFAERADGRMVGFAYGFHGEPGQWWHGVVRQAITEHDGQARTREWLDDAFELAEVHVHPDYQGKGVGRAMVTGLCAGRLERTAVLSTRDQETAARHLYRSLGFGDLLTGFVFPGGQERYAILGTPLPLAQYA
ncbi:GNAT family N-acetyltransferase [Streptosporangium sp. NPDC000239]|uniref:GNAT family N-acetyltransferase n=1 Tax=Streptosporangium sp. NPDC000239 TaxID=3154248 RepID=UPI00331FA0AD